MKITVRKVSAALFFIIILTVFILYKKYHFTFGKSFDYIEAHNVTGWILFLLLYIGTTLILAIPETPFTIAAGVLFKYWEGVGLVFAGSIIGAMIAFLISRYMFHDYFHKKLAHTKFLRWTKITDQNKLAKIVLFSRVNPAIPFNFSNYVFALTKIKTYKYFIATAIGIIIPSIVLVFVGNKLDEMISPGWIVLISIICMVASVIYIYKEELVKSYLRRR